MLDPRHRTIPILALATAGCLWGAGFFFVKIALAEMSVTTMVLFRFVFACLGILPFFLRERPHFEGREWLPLLLASALGVPIQFLVQFKGLSLTTVSHAALMVGTLPMLLAVAFVVPGLLRLETAMSAAPRDWRPLIPAILQDAAFLPRTAPMLFWLYCPCLPRLRGS
jgi:drug/metabolite transporter (DMT)-like permease